MTRTNQLSPALQGRLAYLMRGALHLSTAARIEGISPAVLQRWLRDPRPPFRDLRDALDRAEAEGEALLIAEIRSQTGADRKLAMGLLEKRYPGHWAGRPMLSDVDLIPEEAERNSQPDDPDLSEG
jgi:hypothetical protein